MRAGQRADVDVGGATMIAYWLTLAAASGGHPRVDPGAWGSLAVYVLMVLGLVGLGMWFGRRA